MHLKTDYAESRRGQSGLLQRPLQMDRPVGDGNQGNQNCQQAELFYQRICQMRRGVCKRRAEIQSVQCHAPAFDRNGCHSRHDTLYDVPDS